MIVQVIYLEDYDWLIKVFYAVTAYYTDKILKELRSIECPRKYYKRAKDLLLLLEYNTGFTYTDDEKHVTFIIIGLSDSAKEFANTYDHEKGHAATHIAQYYNIGPYSELFLYLQGEIGLEMFLAAKNLMCEECRQGFISSFTAHNDVVSENKD